MPNLYATPAEIKAAIPDGIRTTTIKYDPLYLRLASEVSRWIDRECKRRFYPALETRYYDSRGQRELAIDDLFSITSVSYSDDDGETYTALTAADYIATTSRDYNAPQSYNTLTVDLNSDTLSYWPSGQRAVKIVGVWGYSDDRANGFELISNTVQNNPLTSGGVSLSVSDVDGLDAWGAYASLQAGQLLRIESEYIETTLAIDISANTIGIVRARNGTTAAAHVQGTAIYIWRVPEPVRQAAVIQAARQVERGFQSYGDARANAEVGQLFFFKQIDPEAAVKLAPYRNMEFA